jgi:hypothetical protein
MPLGGIAMNHDEIARRKRVQYARLLFAGAWRSHDVAECIRAARRVDAAERALARYMGEDPHAVV